MVKLCKDCKWFVIGTWDSNDEDAEDMKVHFGSCTVQTYNPVDGKPIRHLAHPMAWKNRKHECGASGVYWEARDDSN